MKPVTEWYRFNVNDQKWDYNHLEVGHVDKNIIKPQGNPKQTKEWSKATWLSYHKHLNKKNEVV